MIRTALLIALLPLSAATASGGEPAASPEPVFDVHVHIWNGADSVREYLAQLEADGVSTTRFGAIHMARRGEPEHTRAKNDELVALSREHPALVPIASVHPLDGESALAELRRLAEAGVRAIKLHPHTQKFDAEDEGVLAVCRLAGELGMVVLVDNANIVTGDNAKLFNLALALPDTHFVFTHLGGLEFRFWNVLPLARTAEGLLGDNIHFDISALVTLLADSPIEDEFVWTIRNVGVEHVMLGSDYPQLSLAAALDALERLDLTTQEKRLIRWENAHRLFGESQAD